MNLTGRSYRGGQPWTVITAAILTYLGSAVPLIGGVLELLAWQFDDNDLPHDRGYYMTNALIQLVLSIAACTFAALTQRRHSTGRIALTFVGCLAVIYWLVLAAGDTAVLPLIAWVATAVALLWLPDSNAWFSRT